MIITATEPIAIKRNVEKKIELTQKHAQALLDYVEVIGGFGFPNRSLVKDVDLVAEELRTQEEVNGYKAALRALEVAEPVDMLTRGVALALSIQVGVWGQGVMFDEVAKACGLTVADLKAAKCDQRDMEVLTPMLERLETQRLERQKTNYWLRFITQSQVEWPEPPEDFPQTWLYGEPYQHKGETVVDVYAFVKQIVGGEDAAWCKLEELYPILEMVSFKAKPDDWEPNPNDYPNQGEPITPDTDEECGEIEEQAKGAE